MRAVSRLFDGFVLRLGIAGSLAIVAVALLSVVEIFRRYVLNAPSVWSTDLVIAVAAITYVFAGPYVQIFGRHVEITVLSDRFTGRVRWSSEILKMLVGLVYIGALFYGAVQMAGSSLATGERTGTAWDVPVPQIIKVALVIALALFLMLLLRRLYRVLRAGPNGKVFDLSFESTPNPEKQEGGH